MDELEDWNKFVAGTIHEMMKPSLSAELMVQVVSTVLKPADLSERLSNQPLDDETFDVLFDAGVSVYGMEEIVTIF